MQRLDVLAHDEGGLAGLGTARIGKTLVSWSGAARMFFAQADQSAVGAEAYSAVP
jgi:hypothetical protein